MNNQLVRPGGMYPGGQMGYGMMGNGAMMPVDNGYGLNDVANLFIQQQVLTNGMLLVIKLSTAHRYQLTFYLPYFQFTAHPTAANHVPTTADQSAAALLAATTANAV